MSWVCGRVLSVQSLLCGCWCELSVACVGVEVEVCGGAWPSVIFRCLQLVC